MAQKVTSSKTRKGSSEYGAGGNPGLLPSLEQPIKDAVITVPAFFNQAERRAVLQAARMAGLKVLQLINDNTATALSYGVFRRKDINTTAQVSWGGTSHRTWRLAGCDDGDHLTLFCISFARLALDKMQHQAPLGQRWGFSAFSGESIQHLGVREGFRDSCLGVSTERHVL